MYYYAYLFSLYYSPFPEVSEQYLAMCKHIFCFTDSLKILHPTIKSCLYVCLNVHPEQKKFPFFWAISLQIFTQFKK